MLLDLFDDDLLDAAQKLACPYCHAEPGALCVNKTTKKPLRYAPPHITRLKNADRLMRGETE